METKDLVNYVKTCTKIDYEESSAYKLPPRFYKPVRKYMEDVEAFGEKNKIGITGAAKRFVASDIDIVCEGGAFCADTHVDIDGDTYYFLFSAKGYDMSFACKSIERNNGAVKVLGFTKEEVIQAVNEAGVEYEPTKDYFNRLG